MIGIIGAMSTEVDSLIQKINNPKFQKIGCFSFVAGTIYNKEVVVLKSGIGKVASAVGASLLIQNYNPSFIINTGIAGGVGPLKSEDIVLSLELSYGDVDATVFGYKLGQVPKMPYVYEADKTYTVKIEQILKNNGYNYKIGHAVTSDSFITSLDMVHSEHFSNMICEMEGASIAQACYMLNVPFVSLRYISDILGEASQIETYNEFENKMAYRSCDIILDIIRDLK